MIPRRKTIADLDHLPLPTQQEKNRPLLNDDIEIVPHHPEEAAKNIPNKNLVIHVQGLVLTTALKSLIPSLDLEAQPPIIVTFVTSDSNFDANGTVIWTPYDIKSDVRLFRPTKRKHLQ
jgi:hypothetical protein